MEERLKTLKSVKWMFSLQSDYSTQCNGYKALCATINELETRLNSKPKDCKYGQHSGETGKCSECGKTYIHGK